MDVLRRAGEEKLVGKPTKAANTDALTAVMSFWGIVFAVQFTLFCLLRKWPRLRTLYNVRDTNPALNCELAKREFWFPFGWIPGVLQATEEELFQQVGMDGVTYLHTLWMGTKLSAVGCFVAVFAIPTFATSPTEEEGPDGFLIPRSNYNVTDPIDSLSAGHTYVGDPRMAASVIAIYLMSFCGMYLLHHQFAWYTDLRHRYLQRAKPKSYSVYFAGIPDELRSKQALGDYLGTLFPDVAEIQFAVKTPQLNKLVEKRERLAGALAHSEGLLAMDGKRRTRKEKGKDVDEIESLTAELQEATVAVSEAQAALKKEWEAHEEAVAAGASESLTQPPASILPGAFVTFRSKKSAAAAIQLTAHATPAKMVPHEAPNPPHVWWPFLALPPAQKLLGRVLAAVATTAICLFWTIPITFVASLQKVEELKKLGPSGCEEAGNCPMKVATDHVPLLEEILAVIAPLALMAVQYMLPIVLWYVCRLECHIGVPSFTASLYSKLVLFTLVQTFFVSAVAGALISEIDAFIDDPVGQAQHILASSLPAQAVPFISLIFVKMTYKLMMELLRPRSGWQAWLRKYVGPRATAEERKQVYTGLSPLIWNLRPLCVPEPLKFPPLFADMVLFHTILFVYAALSPIVCGALLVAFLFYQVAMRHQMIYIHNPGNDTGGLIWLQFAQYFIVSMLLGQVTVLGVLGLNESPGAPAVVPLILITLLFKKYLHQHHWAVAARLPPLVAAPEDGSDLPFLCGAYVRKELKPLPPPPSPQDSDLKAPAPADASPTPGSAPAELPMASTVTAHAGFPSAQSADPSSESQGPASAPRQALAAAAAEAPEPNFGSALTEFGGLDALQPPASQGALQLDHVTLGAMPEPPNPALSSPGITVNGAEPPTKPGKHYVERGEA